MTKLSSVYLGNSTNNNTGLPRGDSSIKTKPTHDGKRNPIDRKAPGLNQPMSHDSKLIPYRKEYWCGTCDRWGRHDLEHHDGWKQHTKEYFNKKKASKDDVNDKP
jgi:hypothetical protein